ncbi:MAG TPA: hypothetical protein VFP25_00530 [Nitrososphaeraceae archaeon]|nr:hypothetical protein [Nitrososphaeraceae archaeon]
MVNLITWILIQIQLGYLWTILKTMVLRHNKGSYRNKIQFLFAEVVSQGKGGQVLA